MTSSNLFQILENAYKGALMLLEPRLQNSTLSFEEFCLSMLRR